MGTGSATAFHLPIPNSINSVGRQRTQVARKPAILRSCTDVYSTFRLALVTPGYVALMNTAIPAGDSG